MKKLYYFFSLYCICSLFGSNTLLSQIGLFTVEGNFTILSSGTYELQVKDLTGPGIGHDHINASGDLTLDGTLDILLEGYDPDSKDSFEIISYDGTLSGAFDEINWPSSMTLQGWDIDYGEKIPGKVTIFGQENSLPVELVSFNVTGQGDSHLLQWETSSELNSDYFLVDYSNDGMNYVSLGEIASAGTSSTIQKYSYSHKPNSSSIHYYRLKQFDLDGSFEYSNIVSLAGSSQNTLTLFPNPSSGLISFSKPVVGVSVYNLQGMHVLEFKNQADSYDLSSLGAGTFLVKTIGDLPITRRLVIVK